MDIFGGGKGWKVVAETVKPRKKPTEPNANDRGRWWLNRLISGRRVTILGVQSGKNLLSLTLYRLVAIPVFGFVFHIVVTVLTIHLQLRFASLPHEHALELRVKENTGH